MLPGVTARTFGRLRAARWHALVALGEHDQRAAAAARAPAACRDHLLRLGGRHGQLVDHGQRRLGTSRRQRRAHAPAAASCAGRSLWYERGCGPKTTPPPRQCGARVEPWRARPVPFWRHGFLPPPATSPRVLVSWRALALVGQLGDDRLVDDGPVRLDAEHPLVQLELPTTSPRDVLYVDLVIASTRRFLI